MRPEHRLFLLPRQLSGADRRGMVCNGEESRTMGAGEVEQGDTKTERKVCLVARVETDDGSMKSYVVKDLARKVLPASCYLELAKWWHYLPNIGLKHMCPMCGKHLKAFLPYGLHPRPNAQCPFCGSLERHRSIWLFLKNRLNLFYRGIRVLHLAPEPWLRTKLSQLPDVHYVTAEFAPTRVSVRIDVQFMPFRDDSFDCILCSHVLEHVPDDQKAMREMFRILKPCGWAILQVPLDGSRDETFEDVSITSPEERERVFGQRDHIRIYGKDYKQRLANAGFVIQFDSFIDKGALVSRLHY